MLLSKGANPNIAARRSDGTVITALGCAAVSGSTELCKKLLEHGARVDIGGENICCNDHQYRRHNYQHVFVIIFKRPIF